MMGGHRRIVAKGLVFALAAAPGVLLAAELASGALRADPYPTVVRETGFWSLRLLLASLAASPLHGLAGWSWPLSVRRMLGLFAAAYAAAHVAAWCKDYGFAWRFLLDEIMARPFLAAGAAGAVLLLPLALSSNRSAVRRLGRAWQRLHALVYPAALAAYAHYLLAIPAFAPEAAAEGIALALLLGWRLHRGSRQGDADASRGRPRGDA